MKLNDFKNIQKPAVNEGFWDALVGNKTAASFRSMGSGVSGKKQMSVDLFVQDFVSDAMASLQTAVKGNLVDPKTKSSEKPVNPSDVPKPGDAAPNTTAPSAASSASAPTKAAKPGTAAVAGKFNQQKQVTQNMNQYIQSTAKTLNATKDKNQKMALTKELVNYMADRKGTPEWDNGLATVQQMIKKGNVDPAFANSAISRIKAGQTMAEAWQIYYINKLLEAVDLTWEDMGLVVLKESSSKQYIIAESKYYKLNNLFESMLTESQTISDYMKGWFAKYMGNVNYGSSQAQVDKIINSIEQNYPKVKPQLTQLANLAYAISKGGAPGAADADKKEAPVGQQEPSNQEAPKAAAPAAAKPAAGQMNSHQMAQKIKTDLAKLSKVDPKLYSDLIKSLKA